MINKTIHTFIAIVFFLLLSLPILIPLLLPPPPTVQTEQCAFCNFQGECIEKADGSYGCRCLQWFSGEQCQINLRGELRNLEPKTYSTWHLDLTVFGSENIQYIKPRTYSS